MEAVAEAAILVVDDDAPIRRMLSRTLGAEGYAVALAADGSEALVEVERSVPDLIVLDVAMPGLDGITVSRRLRARGLAVPILMLTARDELEDRVRAFETDELLARVRALLRRGHAQESVVGHGDVSLSLDSRVVTRGGRSFELSGREADLLALLLRNARHVVTREQALSIVWQGDAHANVVDRYVSNLRRKLGDPPLIETVRGIGFVLGR
jgi:two-component system response regulator MprA